MSLSDAEVTNLWVWIPPSKEKEQRQWGVQWLQTPTMYAWQLEIDPRNHVEMEGETNLTELSSDLHKSAVVCALIP